jgi:hypothetical protein
MKNASHESCLAGWELFKAAAELMPGCTFGHVRSGRVPWPDHDVIGRRLINRGLDPVSASTFAGFKRLFREGRDYKTRNEVHYPNITPDPDWVPVAFGAYE